MECCQKERSCLSLQVTPSDRRHDGKEENVA